MIAIISIATTGVAIAMYLILGSVIDWHQSRRGAQREHAMNALTESTFVDHDSAGEALRELRGVPLKVMWSLATAVPLHFDDQLSRRIVNVIGATNARRRIERLASSRFWFRRARAARLAHVLPESDSDIVERLLNDSSASVQAATIESFGTDQIARHGPSLLTLLDHQNQSVRFTAQQALLRGDGRITEPLRAWLLKANESVAHFGLEVAANLDDPRLVSEVRRFATSTDPAIRRLVARATPIGAEPEELSFFEEFFKDPDPQVRATAIESSTRIDADWLLPAVAHGLTDRSWKVRRAAGQALAKSGPLGNMYLRSALNSTDPYAADMARVVLVMGGRTEEVTVPTTDEPVDSLVAWAQR